MAIIALACAYICGLRPLGTIKFYRNLPFNGLQNHALWMPQEGRVSYRDLLVTQQPRGYTNEFLWFSKGRQSCGGRSCRRPHKGPMAQKVPIYLGLRAPEVPIEPYGATGNHMVIIGP